VVGVVGIVVERTVVVVRFDGREVVVRLADAETSTEGRGAALTVRAAA
jgi:hypothetical protein